MEQYDDDWYYDDDDWCVDDGDTNYELEWYLEVERYENGE